MAKPAEGLYGASPIRNNPKEDQALDDISRALSKTNVSEDELLENASRVQNSLKVNPKSAAEAYRLINAATRDLTISGNPAATIKKFQEAAQGVDDVGLKAFVSAVSAIFSTPEAPIDDQYSAFDLVSKAFSFLSDPTKARDVDSTVKDVFEAMEKLTNKASAITPAIKAGIDQSVKQTFAETVAEAAISDASQEALAPGQAKAAASGAQKKPLPKVDDLENDKDEDGLSPKNVVIMAAKAGAAITLIVMLPGIGWVGAGVLLYATRNIGSDEKELSPKELAEKEATEAQLRALEQEKATAGFMNKGAVRSASSGAAPAKAAVPATHSGEAAATVAAGIGEEVQAVRQVVQDAGEVLGGIKENDKSKPSPAKEKDASGKEEPLYDVPNRQERLPAEEARKEALAVVNDLKIDMTADDANTDLSKLPNQQNPAGRDSEI